MIRIDVTALTNPLYSSHTLAADYLPVPKTLVDKPLHAEALDKCSACRS